MSETDEELRTRVIKETAEKMAEFQRLFQAKCEKMANIYLGKVFYTQLSYLPKEQQEYHLATVKKILYGYLIKFLNQL